MLEPAREAEKALAKQVELLGKCAEEHPNDTELQIAITDTLVRVLQVLIY